MNIIVVSEGVRKGNPVSLPHRQVMILGIALAALCVLLGVVAYRISALVDEAVGPQSAIASYKRELAGQRAAIKQAHERTEAHLNALAQRLGSLQAQMLRLNALGNRLARMANIDTREFNFEAIPAMGGPEKAILSPAPLDVTATLRLLAEQVARSEARLLALEGVLLDHKLVAQITPSGWPVEGGWVSSDYGMRADPFTGRQSWHEGVDIAARFGSPVYVAGDGVVTWASEKAGYGLLVEVTHESGLVTRYAHTSGVLVKVGDRVAKGQVIARVGSSGRSTGPHLHFEVVQNERPVNPAAFLRK